MSKKKIPIIDKDRFIESVYHLVIYGNTARSFNQLLLNVGDKVNGQERMLIRYSIQWNIMLMTVSLIDELNKYLFVYKPLDEETILKLESHKHIVDPILDEMDKWVDIRKFRNNVLAHNFRIDSDDFKSVHLNNRLKSYNIPESTIDLITLLKYIDSITKITEEIFVNEYNQALAIIDGFSASRKQERQSFDDEATKFNLILAEVNKRITEYNLKLRVFGE